MKTIEEILNGPCEEAPTLPIGWTEADSILIGLPVVAGTKSTGFVGAIQRLGANPVTVWHGEVRAYAGEAWEDVRAEAVKRKGAGG